MDRPGDSTPGEDAAWNTLRQQVTISLRPVGMPTPIGLLGLAAASLLLSGLQLGWVDQAQTRTVALALIGFVFGALLLAAVFSFLARDGTAATAMATLALAWLVVGMVLLIAEPGTTSSALGLFLLFVGTAMSLAASTAALTKLVPATVFAVAALRFFLTAGYELTAGAGWRTASGLVGLALFGLAMYAAWAAELEDALGRTILSLGRRGKGKTAVHGSLREQVNQIATKPGVRDQL
jgi:succinate-acetate transporter protein